MTKIRTGGFLLVVLLGTAFFVSCGEKKNDNTGEGSSYNKSAVVQRMYSLLSSLQNIQSMNQEGDFESMAGEFAKLKADMKSLNRYTPPKGEKAEWDRIHNAIIAFSEKGSAASEAGDSEAISQLVQSIKSLQQEGHMKFK